MNNSFLKISIASLVFFLSPMAALASGPAAINLGSAGNFSILAKTGISTTGTTAIVGDIGVSPAAATYITGFGLNLPVGSAYATSALVTGKVYAPGYADPTSSNLTAVVHDMENAYTNGNGMTNPTATEVGAGNIGGMTLAPGLYKWGTSLVVPTDVTLSGGSNDVWVFQIAQNLDISSATKVILSGGAQASNIFWIVAGQTTLGTTSVFSGNILDKTAIVLKTGAILNGRALAQTAVTLDSNSVNGPVSISVIQIPPVILSLDSSNNTNINTNQNSNQYSNTNSYSYQNTNFKPNPDVSIDTALLPSTLNLGQQVKSIRADLTKGSVHSDIRILQQFLISENKGPASVVLANHPRTPNFGVLTKAALGEFQASVGIAPAYGNFGSITRAYLSAHY